MKIRIDQIEFTKTATPITIVSQMDSDCEHKSDYYTEEKEAIVVRYEIELSSDHRELLMGSLIIELAKRNEVSYEFVYNKIINQLQSITNRLQAGNFDTEGGE